MADLDEVIFTPQKKQKKRTAATLIASSLEDLKTQLGVDGTPSFPQLAARAPISAALSKVVPMSVAPQNPTPAPVASASGTTTGSALSAAAAVGAATVTSGSSPASSVKATVTKHTSSTVSASDDSAKKGIKRKSDADPSVPKSAKKPPTAPKMAAVTPAASASLKPISSIFSKKITSFLVSQSPSAPSAQEAVQSSPQAKDVSTIESPKSQVIEIDME